MSARRVEMPAADERVSRRTWSKGSARGDGPAQAAGAVVVRAGVRWVKCEGCPSARRADAKGRHGAMPPYRLTPAEREAWPRCEHGLPWWVACHGRVPPPCCAGVQP